MNEIVDYAYPCMMAENALKKAHDAMLEQDYDTAIDEAFVAIAETKLMINAIKDMKERQDALRK
jgi:hypothetical protein